MHALVCCYWPRLLSWCGFVFLAALAAAPQAATLVPSYVESSSGLELPGLENGRTELVFGDVDGDGHVDLVSVGDHGSPFINSDQHGIMVWFGDGAGNWSLHMEGYFGYGGVALGDVNNDGLMDIGYGIHHNSSGSDFGDQLLEVALGDGTGRNWTPWDDGLATNGETWGMFGTDFADVNNNGHLDVGSISFGCCAGVHVYLNNTDGTWTRSFGFLGGNSDMIFVFGDVNGDGHADFAAGHGSGTVYLGDGEGNFTLADANLPGPTWRGGVSLGDVTGDGRDDLALTTADGIGVYTWQDGLWHDLSGELAALGSGWRFTQIADMDNDGFGDLVVLRNAEARVYLGDGAGNWTLAATVPTESACRVLALTAGADFDHNGHADLAYVAEENCQWWIGGTNELHAWRETSEPVEPWIHPVRPRGGEVFIAGSVRFIDWRAAIPGDRERLPAMTIELSLTGPEGPFQPIAEGAPGNGCYQWLVPTDLPASADCYLRLTLSTDPVAVAITPAPLTIATATATAVSDPGVRPGLPAAMPVLGAAGPNPFNPRTSFWLDLPGPAAVTLTVHDARGRLVSTLLDCNLGAGRHHTAWDGCDDGGREMGSGVYLVRLVADGVAAPGVKVTLNR